MKIFPTLPPPIDLPDRIAFYGPMTSGKTFCANYLYQKFGYRRYSLANKLKKIVHEVYGPLQKDGIGRGVYQSTGAFFREYDPDCWIKLMMQDMADDSFDYSDGGYAPKLVVDDVRYTNEAERLATAGFLLVRVQTPLEVRQGRFKALYPSLDMEAASTHKSEQEFDLIKANYTVDSTDDRVFQALDYIVKAVVSPV